MFMGPGLSAWRTAGGFDYSAVSGYIVDVSADFVTESSGAVSALVDQSGNSHDFSQGTGTAQPAYEATGWGDGTPSVLFDGINDVLVCATSLPTAFSGADTTFTVFLVGQIVALADGSTRVARWGLGSTVANPRYIDGAVGSSRASIFTRDDAGTLKDTASELGVLDTSAHVYTTTSLGTTSTMHIDGLQVLSGDTDVGTRTFTRMAIGALVTSGTPQFFCNLRFKRLIGYTGALSSGDRVAIEAALLAEHF